MSRSRWLTPDNAPDGTRDIVLTVPKGDEWEAIVRGALASLVYAYNYEQNGSYTPEETAAIFQDAVEQTMQWSEVP